MLASVAYPLVWATLHNIDFAPYWGYQGGYILLATIVPLLVAVALARRSGRVQPK